MAFGGIRKRPTGLGLPPHRLKNERDRFIEFAENFGFCRAASLAELKVTVPKVAGIGDSRSDVVTEVSGQVKHQVSDAVPLREGIAPELVVRERIDPLVKVGGAFAKLMRKSGGKYIA